MVKKFILKYELSSSDPALILYQNWTNTWLMLLAGGLVGALIYWTGGIKYFLIRLKWCGLKNPDKALARKIGIYTALIYSLPGLGILLFETFIFKNLKAAISYPGVGWEILSFQFMWLSCHYQCVLVKRKFQLNGFRPFIWFYLFPFVLQSIYLHQKFYARVVRDFVFDVSL